MFIPSEVSQREKDKSHMIPLICGIFFFLKKGTTELLYKTEIDPQTRRQTYVYQRGKGREG